MEGSGRERVPRMRRDLCCGSERKTPYQQAGMRKPEPPAPPYRGPKQEQVEVECTIAPARTWPTAETHLEPLQDGEQSTR